MRYAPVAACALARRNPSRIAEQRDASALVSPRGADLRSHRGIHGRLEHRPRTEEIADRLSAHVGDCDRSRFLRNRRRVAEVVHPGAVHRDDTLVSALLARYPDIAAAGDPDDDSEEVLEAFGPPTKSGVQTKPLGTGGIWAASSGAPRGRQYGDEGSPARFFYSAKATKADRRMRSRQEFKAARLSKQNNGK